MELWCVVKIQIEVVLDWLATLRDKLYKEMKKESDLNENFTHSFNMHIFFDRDFYTANIFVKTREQVAWVNITNNQCYLFH